MNIDIGIEIGIRYGNGYGIGVTKDDPGVGIAASAGAGMRCGVM
jgi:hypothetical protein